MNQKIVLITGVSSGMGKETALLLAKEGYRVYGTARNTEHMKDLEKAGVSLLSIDVTDEESMSSGIQKLLQAEGRVDILINNAGYGSYGAIEDVDLSEARHQFEVNLFGLARMIQLVLPSMRENRYGKIINISSMGGRISAPFGGWYHATKYALEGFSNCLRMETKPFGIDVILIEPGVIQSKWSSHAIESLRSASGKGAYKGSANQVAEALTRQYSGKQLSSPQLIATTISKALRRKNPKTRYLVGYGAKLSVIVSRLVSDRTFDRIISKVMS